MNKPSLERVLEEVVSERKHQYDQWGDDHDINHTPFDWNAFITFYLGKALEPVVNDIGKEDYNLLIFRYNMIKIAALAIAAAEAIDRKTKQNDEV